MENLYPRSFNHVGVGVSDLEQAIQWYGTVFGFVLLGGPFEVHRDGSHAGRQATEVLGKPFQKMRMAHLTTGNGIGFELFQLLDPSHERRSPALEFWKNGFFHVCITDPNIENAVNRIVERGGKQLSQIWQIDEAVPGYSMCYCEDPFGNILEIYTHSYDQLYGGLSGK
jgi:catechol 2,3-dioxygenase-like lactoylglutathione lyase family enzyme